jgi:hypothetical protein
MFYVSFVPLFLHNYIFLLNIFFFFFLFETRSHYVTQADLELLACLSFPSNWDLRDMPLNPSCVKYFLLYYLCYLIYFTIFCLFS